MPGREEALRKPTLSNCYVIPIEDDSLEGIYRCLSESAMVYRTGGGVGTDLSILRPKGAPVNATVDKSPGCTAFMNLLSENPSMSLHVMRELTDKLSKSLVREVSLREQEARI